MDLSHATLRGTLLENANLRQTRLVGCDLREAMLARADLSGAVLQQADLSHASLATAKCEATDFGGAQLLKPTFNKPCFNAAISRWRHYAICWDTKPCSGSVTSTAPRWPTLR